MATVYQPVIGVPQWPNEGSLWEGNYYEFTTVHHFGAFKSSTQSREII